MIENAPLPRIERWDALGDRLGVDLYIVRDDLLPFPLAGNKVRKLVAEISDCDRGTSIVTNGAVDSNHCRTVAWLAAERGLRAHLVLHDGTEQGASAPGLAVLQALGATYAVVPPNEISAEIDRAVSAFAREDAPVRVVPGGCHSKRGAEAYRDAAEFVFNELEIDAVYVASGTGATQGGIAAAAHQAGTHTEVIGVSVARPADRGIPPVAEATAWAGAPNAPITFLDDFIAGGYGMSSPELRAIVALGWRYGLPLDETYTGKAMWALKRHADEGRLAGKRVLFWHTGGLWNRLAAGVFE